MPEAEVIPGILNVGLGDVGYQGVTESEAAYIDRGADTQLTCAWVSKAEKNAQSWD